MREVQLDNYARLDDRDGFRTYFRKFEKGTYFFQYNDIGEFIGGVCLSNEVLSKINNVPTNKVGDGKTKQALSKINKRFF